MFRPKSPYDLVEMTSTLEPIDDRVTVPLRVVVHAGELHARVVPETLRPGALDLPVRWASVCELLDPAPYLLGEELMLTSGMSLPDDRGEVDAYVRRLQAAGVTALGFGITPPLRLELPEPLRLACVDHGLPLLVVPPSVPFLAVARVVAMALGEASQREARRVASAREALTRAATRGLDELVVDLANRLSGWVCLLGEGCPSGGEPLAGHRAPAPLPGPVIELVGRLRRGSGVRGASTELADGTFVVVQPVYPQATSSMLLVAGRPERFGGTDRAIFAVGAALLGLIGGGSTDVAGFGAVVTDLLLDTTGRPEALAALLGPGPYRLLVGVPRAPGRRAPGQVEAGYHWLRARLRTPLIRVTEEPGFVAIVSASGEATAPPDASGAASPARWAGELSDHGWLVAAGSPVPAERLPAAMAELEVLRARAVALRRPLRADPAGLASVVSPDASAVFAQRLLGPVLALDRGRSLLETLRAWLANHGGWDRTAADLGVHRNSVRHRIGQVARALDRDLDDPETRMQLWFALGWLR